MSTHIHIHTRDAATYGKPDINKPSCDCDTTKDAGTSEGARKRWARGKAMNTPEAHAARAANREKAENRAGAKASMARQGKPHDPTPFVGLGKSRTRTLGSRRLPERVIKPIT
jgi:hypothetical protein